MNSMESASNLEMFLKRDRWFVLAGLVGVTALAWAYLVVMAADMDDIALGAMAMPAVEAWSALDFWLMFVMWAVMMVRMMLPGTIDPYQGPRGALTPPWGHRVIRKNISTRRNFGSGVVRCNYMAEKDSQGNAD